MSRQRLGYDGPSEISAFAAFLAPIGEVVIAFARLERRLTWAIESTLDLHPQDADAIQESIVSVSTRIGLFSTVALPHVEGDKAKRSELESIVKKLLKANDYRNDILHGPWFGVQTSIHDGHIEQAAMKSKYARFESKKRESKQRAHSVQEMREQAKLMLNLCREIQVWVLGVFPMAQNRVP